MSHQKSVGTLFRGVVASALVSAALAGFNHLSQEASLPPPPSLRGQVAHYPWRMGNIAYQVAGPEEGEAMLLLHSIHAAASNYEFRKNFDFFAQEGYRVYAPDLLGFGLSDHPAISYDDELYIALIADFVRDVIARQSNVIVSSLSCSYVIAAAARYPERFGSLVLIEPVGLKQLRSKLPLVSHAAQRLIQLPIFGEAFFNALTSPPSLRYYLGKQGYLDQALVTDEMIEYHYNISHQPNARYAPAAFISGALNRNVRDEWASLKNKILIAWGYQATITPVQNGTEFLRLNPRAVINGYDANMLPHDEQAERFNIETLRWLQGRRKN